MTKHSPPIDDSFTLYNLRVEICDRSSNIIGKHKIGDFFEVIGEDIFIPEGQGFSLYALASLAPLIPANERQDHPNDFMESDDYIADPDVNSRANYRIRRTGQTIFKHSNVSTNPPPPSPHAS